jgi:hypothetical protein
VDDTPASVAFRDVVIVGGGCYGSFYAGQLMRARERERAVYRRLVVVDRNPRCQFAREIGESDTCELMVQEWGEFFDRLDLPHPLYRARHLSHHPGTAHLGNG